MNRDELASCSGFHVSVIVEDTPAMAVLHSDDPKRAYLTLPRSTTWTKAEPYYLTDEDIANMSQTGRRELSSMIVLSAPEE